MKWLSLLLFPVLASANVEVQRYFDGYIIVIDNQSCWAMPQTVNLQDFPRDLTDISQVATNWGGEPVGDAYNKCMAALQGWKVAESRGYPTRPLYDINHKEIGRISIGLPCENEAVKLSTQGNEWRYATNKTGLRGIVVCSKNTATTP